MSRLKPWWAVALAFLVTLGLEPSGKALIFAWDRAEADEGVHLVHLAPDSLRHATETVDEGIAGDLEKVALAVQHPPDEAIQ